KIYPWICGRCAREFTRANVRELTVHHRDHNHDNNPSDGSNWELLCVYCHDNEHQRRLEAAAGAGSSPSAGRVSTYAPFADLKERLARKRPAK
ncbi:MAG: YajD family HNH nuclease, partial [Burkholderiales bacterium]